jgi:hypothetical protein
MLRAPVIRKVSEQTQREAGEYMREEEDDDVFEECLVEDTRVEVGEDGEALTVPLGVFSVPVPNRGRYQKKLALIAQAEFGLPTRTEANRLCVQRFLRDYMREERVRETHIARILPVAVGLAFIPNAQHVYERDLLATKPVRDQVELVEGHVDGITPAERRTSWWRGSAPAKEVKFSK